MRFDRVSCATVWATAVLVLSWGSGDVRAASNDWNGNVDNKWETAGNWTGGAPNSSDTMRINKIGTYTVVVDDVTANTGDAATWLTVGGLVLSAATNQIATVAIGFTNTARQLRIPASMSIGPAGTLAVTEGTVLRDTGGMDGLNGAISLLGGTIRYTNVPNPRVYGTILVDGGSFLFPTSGGTDAEAAGAFAVYDYATFRLRSGEARLGIVYMGRGAAATACRRILVEGGQFSATGNVTMIGNGLQSTNMIVVTGGALTVGGIVGNNEVADSWFVVSNGTVNATSIRTRRIEIHGGKADVASDNRISASTEQLLVTGGMFACTNAAGNAIYQFGQNAVGLGARITGGSMAFDTFRFWTDGSMNVSKLATLAVHGGRVLVNTSVNMDYQSRDGLSTPTGIVTSRIDVAGSGVLELKGTIAAGVTTSRHSISNRAGGTIRWTGLNNPSIVMGTGYSFVTADAVIEFKDTAAASLAGTIATAITYAGTNTLSLNHATNAVAAGYTFGASPGQKFMNLRLLNGGMFRGNGTTLNAGSEVRIVLSGTGASQFGRIVDTGTLTLGGTLTVTLAEGYEPQNGDTFDLMDWGARSGTFGTVVLPPKFSSGLLYSDGTIKVTSTGTLIMMR